MSHDHRRILATGIARLRAKIKYRPVVFELMPAELHPAAIAARGRGAGRAAAAQAEFPPADRAAGPGGGNRRRAKETGGRPAKLFRFRREVLPERAVVGTKLPLSR